MKITWVIDPSDTANVPVVGTTTPTQGQGKAWPSGLLINGCGTLYFINKSNVVIYAVFEDGSVTEIPAWWARPYKPRTKTGQIWLTQGAVLNTQQQPISQLTLESFQPNEDTTGLYSGPINYQTNIGGGALSQATQVIQTGQVAPTPVLEATPSASFVGAILESIINNDGSFKFGAGPGANNQNKVVSSDGAGNLFAYTVSFLSALTGHEFTWQSTSANHVQLVDATTSTVLLDMDDSGNLKIIGALLGSTGTDLIRDDGSGNALVGPAGTPPKFTSDGQLFIFSNVQCNNVILPSGQQETGIGGFRYSNQTAGQVVSVFVPFRQQMTNVPSSITLTVNNNTNLSTLTADNISLHGFKLSGTVVANGTVDLNVTYTTVGN